MNREEAVKHRIRRELLKSLAHLLHVSKQLRLAEEHSDLFHTYSELCESIHTNIDALRAGVEETQKIIASEATRIQHLMQTPWAKPPPLRGAYLQTKFTPMQKRLRDAGVKFPSELPKTSMPVKPRKFPEIIPTSPLEQHKIKRKPRTRKKEGIIPI